MDADQKVCKFCGKTLPEGHRKWCGRACMLLYRKENRKKKYCLNCGKILALRHSRWCDAKCRNKVLFRKRKQRREDLRRKAEVLYTLKGLTLEEITEELRKEFHIDNAIYYLGRWDGHKRLYVLPDGKLVKPPNWQRR